MLDLLVFCTKDLAPPLAHIQQLERYRQYWFVTITPYGPEIEPYVPPKEQVLERLKCLSKVVGPSAVAWRYDPILLNETYTEKHYLEEFERMAAALCGYTEVCVISFVDLYEKVKRNFPALQPVSRERRIALGRAFLSIADRYGMVLKTCAEGDELAPYGVDCSGCMTTEVFEKELGIHLDPLKGPRARCACACSLGGDIGQYDTCGHMCRYCYTNRGPEIVLKNRELHDPSSPFLIGGALPGDRIRSARQESWLDLQMRME